jgi:hypothetical protein
MLKHQPGLGVSFAVLLALFAGRVSLSRRHPHRKRRPRCNAADNTNASRIGR